MSPRAQRRWLWVILLSCAAVATLQYGLATYRFATQPETLQWDLQQRHREMRLFEDGTYPRGAYQTVRPGQRPENTVYPANGLPWMWLASPFEAWPANQALMLGTSAVVLLLLGLSIARHAAPDNSLAQGALLAAFLAVGGHQRTLLAGQYGVLLSGLMWLAARRAASGRELHSGLLWGIALLKPTSTLLPLWVLLRTWRWRVLAVAGGVATVSAVLSSAWTGLGPLEPWLTTYSAPKSLHFTVNGHSLVSLLGLAGLAPGVATLASAALAGLFTTLLLRDPAVLMDPLRWLAVAGVASRIGFYHYNYDDLLIAFLLMACLQRFVATAATSALVMGLAVGATLWLPARVAVMEWAFLASAPIWIIATLWLCEARRS